jgi:protein-S-isoprenylcysteine O-methyltransferase Ste14
MKAALRYLADIAFTLLILLGLGFLTLAVAWWTSVWSTWPVWVFPVIFVGTILAAGLVALLWAAIEWVGDRIDSRRRHRLRRRQAQARGEDDGS